MPFITKSRQESFVDDDIVSASPSTITDDSNYMADSFMPVIETSDLVGRSILMSAHEDM